MSEGVWPYLGYVGLLRKYFRTTRVQAPWLSKTLVQATTMMLSTGAQAKFDEKTRTYTVNGSHDNEKMVVLLKFFIKKYVQC